MFWRRLLEQNLLRGEESPPQASRPWNNDDVHNEDQDEGSDEGDNDVEIMMTMSGKLDDDDDDYGEWQAWTTGQVRRG